MGEPTQENDFDAVKARLDEIVQAVSDEDLPLDDALELYEEAVTLGLRISDLLEDGIEIPDDEAASSEGDAPDSADAPDNPAVSASDSDTASQ